MSISTVVPVGQPLPGASFVEAIKRFFKGYVVFSGRASRSEFWWAMLFTFLVSLAVQIPFWILWSVVIARSAWTAGGVASAAGGQDIAVLLGVTLLLMAVVILFSLALILPTYAVMWRRLQDGSFHGAFALLSLVGLGIVPLVMCALPSQPAGLQYDPAYRAQAAAYGYAQAPHGQAAYGQEPYGQAPVGQAPYGQAPYGQAPYGQPQYPQSTPYDHAAPHSQPGPYDQSSPSSQPGPYGQAAGQHPYSGGYAQQQP